MPSLVEIGPVVMEDNMKMCEMCTDRRTGRLTDGR